MSFSNTISLLEGENSTNLHLTVMCPYIPPVQKTAAFQLAS